MALGRNLSRQTSTIAPCGSSNVMQSRSQRLTPRRLMRPIPLASPRTASRKPTRRCTRFTHSSSPSFDSSKSVLGTEIYLLKITVQAQISGLRCCAAEQEGRARVEGAWGARPAHILYMLASAYTRQLQPSSLRTTTAVQTRRGRGDVCLISPAAPSSSGEGSEKHQMDAATVAALETASAAAASRQQQSRAGSLRAPAPGLRGGRSRQHLVEARAASST